jgi:hypothetical protein
MNTRRVAATVLAAALVVPALIGAFRIAGWGFGDDTGGPGTAADGRALRDFAAVLSGSHDVTFTAWYTTGSGIVVTHAQEPPRRAYRSADGLYLAGPDATYLCRTRDGERASCSRAAGTDTVPLSHARALAGVLDGDFIAPELVVAYLGRLSARSPGRVTSTERVIAGQPVRCIAIQKLFSACATGSGVLAEFDAPDGRVTLTGYQAEAVPDTFALPRDATVTDLDSPS